MKPKQTTLRTEIGVTFHLHGWTDYQGTHYRVTNSEGITIVEVVDPETPWPEWRDTMLMDLTHKYAER